MSLDMRLDLGYDGGQLLAVGPTVSFDAHLNNEGYYWHLYPAFEQLAAQTGEMIDLYGDARFQGKNLQCLRDTLVQARTAAESKPSRWNVLVGIQTIHLPPNPPIQKEFREPVSKDRLLQIIDAMIAIVDLAVARNVAVIWVGD